MSWAWLTEEEADEFLSEMWMPSEEVWKRPDVIDDRYQLWGIDFIAPYGHSTKVMRGMMKHSQSVLGNVFLPTGGDLNSLTRFILRSFNMGGGGGKTTNVTNTGLGDDQYQALADNQVGISDQITSAREDATKRYDNFDNRFTTLDTSFTNLNDAMNNSFTNMNDLMSQYDTANQTRFDNVNTGLGANLSAIQGNADALGTLSSDVSGGFDTMGQRFNDVDQANADLQQSVNSGFEDQASAFNDLEGGMNSQFDAAQADRESQFAATNDALNQGMADTQQQLTDTQATVLDGQGNLASDLETLSGRQDAYAAQSLENQEGLQNTQDDFRTSFDNYVDRYSDDTELANQTRADTQRMLATGNEVLREDLGNYAQAAATGQQSLADQAAQNTESLATAMEGGFQNTAQTSQNLRDVLSNQITDTSQGIMANQDAMANTQGELAQGQLDMANTVMQGQNNLANTFMTESGEIDTALVNQTKNLAGIAATQTDLDAGMRDNFPTAFNSV